MYIFATAVGHAKVSRWPFLLYILFLIAAVLLTRILFSRLLKSDVSRAIFLGLLVIAAAILLYAILVARTFAAVF